MGPVYLGTAGVAGAGYLALSCRLWARARARAERATSGDAMRLFGYSITYLTVLFVAMAVDVLVRFH